MTHHCRPVDHYYNGMSSGDLPCTGRDLSIWLIAALAAIFVGLALVAVSYLRRQVPPAV